MADSIRRNRLSPPLMHVFRAAHQARDAKGLPPGTQPTAQNGQRASHRSQRAAITELTLRSEVSRDLEALMNSIAMESSTDLTNFPMVRNSILNFGFPDIAHRTMDELEGRGLEADIENILRRYEPRLVPRSLRVRRDTAIEPEALKVRYVVNSELSCEPLNVALEFVAEVELTTGKILIQRL